MPFISSTDGDLKKAFVTDSWVIDQFVGNRLWLWGYNINGQIGNGNTNTTSNPTQNLSEGVNWSKVFEGGVYFAAAIKTDGTLWLWGNNSRGQLGDNTTVNKSSPGQTITFGTNWFRGDAGQHHIAAIKTDGTLWLWGDNTEGQLGNNTTTHRSSPVQTTSFGNNWLHVSCGYRHTGAIKTDGSLWMWGRNSNGQLGDNTVTNKSIPGQTVTGGTNWKQVACGDYETVALKTDGTLWAWGGNHYGNLGDNTTVHRSSPVQTIAYSNTWKYISERAEATVAIKTDGTLWCWGRNNNGQLGDGTVVHKSSPVQTIAFGNNWKQCSSAFGNTAAVKTDGTLWCWGQNAYGALGDNTTTNRSSPVQTSLPNTNWKQVSVGYRNTYAITYGE